jgi:hypothetical protein
MKNTATQFATVEMQNLGGFYNALAVGCLKVTKTNAITLASAKRVASSRQARFGTTAHVVAVDGNGVISPIANCIRGVWYSVESEEKEINPAKLFIVRERMHFARPRSQ